MKHEKMLMEPPVLKKHSEAMQLLIDVYVYQYVEERINQSIWN
jgi:hypothetical protein